jgi:hypothetical protein
MLQRSYFAGNQKNIFQHPVFLITSLKSSIQHYWPGHRLGFYTAKSFFNTLCRLSSFTCNEATLAVLHRGLCHWAGTKQ